MKKLKYLIVPIVAVILIIGCTSAKITPKPDGSGYSTNYIVDPKLETALITAGAVNSATAPVNPFAPVIDIGLAAVAAIAAWVAKRKNDAANQSALLLKTVIQGVENAGDSKVKEVIQKQAVAIGVEGELGTTVQKVNNGSI